MYNSPTKGQLIINVNDEFTELKRLFIITVSVTRSLPLSIQLNVWLLITLLHFHL